MLVGEVTAGCSDGNTKCEVCAVGTVRNSRDVQALSPFGSHRALQGGSQKRTSDLLMGHAANGLVSSVAGENVR